MKVVSWREVGETMCLLIYYLYIGGRIYGGYQGSMVFVWNKNNGIYS